MDRERWWRCLRWLIRGLSKLSPVEAADSRGGDSVAVGIERPALE